MEPGKDFNLTVGLRIREIRESGRMTRAQFSEKCGISESFLTAVERGCKGITSKTLYKICTAFDVSADYFIFGHEGGRRLQKRHQPWINLSERLLLVLSGSM